MPTPFQQAVWDALTHIPYGSVVTYGELARFVGSPKAVRAVATAVGKNPDAPRVPCHRVIPSSGKIGKYSGSGGVQTKIALLASEGVTVRDGRVQDLSQRLWSASS